MSDYHVERTEVGSTRRGEDPDVWWTVFEGPVPIEDYPNEEEARKRVDSLERGASH